MKTLVNVVVWLLLLLTYTTAFGQDEVKQHPRNVKQAVSTLLQTLPAEEQEFLLGMPKERLIDLHFGLGLYIRNTIIRHGGPNGGFNKELMKSCAKKAGIKESDLHIDGCSGIICEALWKEVRDRADPAMAKALDEQFEALKIIKITDHNYEDRNLGEVIDDINLQIADFLKSARGSKGVPKNLIVTIPSEYRAGSGRAISKFLGTDSKSLLNVIYFFEDRGVLRVKRQPPEIILHR